MEEGEKFREKNGGVRSREIRIRKKRDKETECILFLDK